ncbi:hypothetical protein V8B97DRAFT_2025072 [Scleroderma yunnanense]
MSITSILTVTIDIVLDRRYVKEVLHAILYAILFHRLFGTVKPQTFEVLDVTVPSVSDPEMEQLVNDKVDTFWKGVENGTNKRGQVLVTFSEKRPKKSLYVGEDVPWEQWCAYIFLLSDLQPLIAPTDRQDFDSTLASTLSKALHVMLTYTSSEMWTNYRISPFPIKISVKMDGVDIG